MTPFHALSLMPSVPQGWNTQDPNSVRYEYTLPDGRRADYVLCDRHGCSAAVIEAKRFSTTGLCVAAYQAKAA